MAAQDEVVEQGGHAVEPVQPLQGLPLVALPGDRVRAVHGESRVRPGLLEHDRLPRPPVATVVRAAAVEVVQGALDPVRQAGDGRARPGGRMGCENGGQPHPGGRTERRTAHIGHQPAGEVLDRRHRRPVGRVARPVGESAVADVGPQRGEDDREPVLVGRVDRHELDVEARRHMDLPALRGEFGALGAGDHPLSEPGALPPVGGRTAGLGEVAELFPGTAGRFVEVGIQEAVGLVTHVHGVAPVLRRAIWRCGERSPGITHEHSRVGRRGIPLFVTRTA